MCIRDRTEVTLGGVLLRLQIDQVGEITPVGLSVVVSPLHETRAQHDNGLIVDRLAVDRRNDGGAGARSGNERGGCSEEQGSHTETHCCSGSGGPSLRVRRSHRCNPTAARFAKTNPPAIPDRSPSSGATTNPSAAPSRAGEST